MRIVTDAERRNRIGVRHALASTAIDPEAAARAVTCLHATEPASLYLSAFARSGASRSEVADALYRKRTLVRQLGMRRTVFAMPTNLFAAVRGSASTRVAAQLAVRLAKDIELAGITSDGSRWVAQVRDDTRQSIRDLPATTTQLRSRVDELNARIPVEGRPGADTPVAPRLLIVLAADGSVLRGANDGDWRVSRPVWTAAEQWLGVDPGVLDERAGYRDLISRWLWSFGPGTEDDLVWWLGSTKSTVRRALDDVGAVPAQLEDGTKAWLHPEDVEPVRGDDDWAALLPALDPSTMGWRGRDFYLANHADRIFDRNGNGGPTAWWNGQIVGSWAQHPDGEVFVLPIAPLPSEAFDALSHEAERLSGWLDGDIVRTVYQAPLVRTFNAE